MHPSQIGLMSVKFRKKEMNTNIDDIVKTLTDIPISRYYSVNQNINGVTISMQGHLPSLVNTVLDVATNPFFISKILNVFVQTNCYLLLFPNKKTCQYFIDQRPINNMPQPSFLEDLNKDACVLYFKTELNIAEQDELEQAIQQDKKLKGCQYIEKAGSATWSAEQLLEIRLNAIAKHQPVRNKTKL